MFNEILSFIDHPFIGTLLSIGNVVILVMIGLSIAMIHFRSKGLDPSTAVEELDDYPMITVVMCCKGVHEKSESNFKRNLGMKYKGPVEFIFVVEDAADPAAELANDIISKFEFDEDLVRSAKVTVAGVSFHNAQKIHNMLHGVAVSDPESGYVLFADDDVFFYPGLIEQLLQPLQKEPNRVVLSTGYEFQVPPPNANIVDYALLFYRYHNLWSFITDRPVLCWGGCWFAPLDLFRKDRYSLVDAYLDGGYSDDTIISCLVQQHEKVCAHPPRAIFPNELDPNTSFKKYYEFLLRQMFVTDTYSTGYNRRVSHSLAFLIFSSVTLMGLGAMASPFFGIVSILSLLEENHKWSFVCTMSTLSLFLWFTLVTLMNISTETMLAVSNSVRPPNQQCVYKRSYVKMLLGTFLHILCLPISVCTIMLNDSIVWAGVRYYKKDGKIVKVERKAPNGDLWTEMFASSISETIQSPAYQNSFVKWRKEMVNSAPEP